MLISITYCQCCNYRPIATKLAMDLKMELECESEYVIGNNGAFEVSRDGELIFSKQKLSRWPKKGEILGILKGELVSNPDQ